jgi:hypothetical protein
VRFAEGTVRQAVVGHQEENAGCGRDAGERAGEHAYEDADVNEQAKEGDAANLCEDTQRGLASAQILPDAAQAEHFGVSTCGEDGACEKGALNDRAGNCFQRIAGFGAEGGGAFESDEAEEREDEAEAQAAAGHPVQLELRPIEVPAVSEEDEDHHDQDERDGYGFDP